MAWHTSQGGPGPLSYDALVDMEREKAREMFDKRLIPLDTSHCRFPDDLGQLFAEPGWEDAELQEERHALNAVKSRLDNMERREWERAATQSDRAAEVKFKLRNEFQVEMATVAWAKMYETIFMGNFFHEADPALPCGSDGQPIVYTVHLCEAPGAFIAATNHFMKTLRPHWWWDWLGISLNPYYEGNNEFAMIDDDALISQTPNNWCFGADDSGDLRKLENMERLWEEVTMRLGWPPGSGGAFLVTADGAVDCSMDPNRQEEICADLHLCEIIAAAGLLVPGGHFMWKGFTTFEHQTISQLYLMGCLFESVAVYKPSTSKPANSEVYVLGRGFRGVPPEVMQFLKSQVSPKEIYQGRSLFPRQHIESTPGFMESARHSAKSFSRWTQEAIIEALDRNGMMKDLQIRALKDAKKWFADHWCHTLQVQRLEQGKFLASGMRLDGSSNNTGNVVSRKRGRDLKGNLEARKKQFLERVAQLSDLGAQVDPRAQRLLASGGEEGGGGGQGEGDGGGGPGTDGPVQGGAGAGAGNGMAVNANVMKMMSKMGYEKGQGLGLAGQGITEALTVEKRMNRLGLGAGEGLGKGGAAASAARAEWAPQPDTGWLINEHPRPLSWDGDLGGEVDGWEPKLAAVPQAITKSKAVPDDTVLVGLLAACTAAAKLLGTAGSAAAVGRPRQHGMVTGAGVGALGDGEAGRPRMVANRVKREDVAEDEEGEGEPGRGGLGLGASAALSPGADAFVKKEEAEEEGGRLPERQFSDMDVRTEGSGDVKVEGGDGAEGAEEDFAGSPGGVAKSAAEGLASMFGRPAGVMGGNSATTGSKEKWQDTLQEADGDAVGRAGLGLGPGAEQGQGLSAHGDTAASMRLCHHTDPCLAPRGSPGGRPHQRGWFKLAALDAAFGLIAHVLASCTSVPPLLLDLSHQSAGAAAAEYVLERFPPHTGDEGKRGFGEAGGTLHCQRAVLLASPAGRAVAERHEGVRLWSPGVAGAASGKERGEGGGASAGGLGGGGRSFGVRSGRKGTSRRGAGEGGKEVRGADGGGGGDSGGDGDGGAGGGGGNQDSNTGGETAGDHDDHLPGAEGEQGDAQGAGCHQGDGAGARGDGDGGAAASSRGPMGATRTAEAPDMGTDADTTAVAGETDRADVACCAARLWTAESVSALAAETGGSATLVMGDLSGLRRLLGDSYCRFRPTEMEHHIAYRRHLLYVAAAGLACLAPGGCMVLRLGHTLTSFSTTLLYTLFRCFERMWLGSTFASCAAGPERYVVLYGRLQDEGVGASLMAKALKIEVEATAAVIDGSGAAGSGVPSAGGSGSGGVNQLLPPGTRAVSEIFPMPFILNDTNFYKYLADRTQALAVRQTQVLQRVTASWAEQRQSREAAAEAEALTTPEARERHRHRALKELEAPTLPFEQVGHLGSDHRQDYSNHEPHPSRHAGHDYHHPQPQHLMHNGQGHGSGLGHGPPPGPPLPGPPARPGGPPFPGPPPAYHGAAVAGAANRLGMPPLPSSQQQRLPMPGPGPGSARPGPGPEVQGHASGPIHHQHQHHQQQQRPAGGPQGAAHSESEPGVMALATMHPQKGKEPVCKLRLDPWPVEKLVGMNELVIYEQQDRRSLEGAMRHKQPIKAKPVAAQDARSLQTLIDYMVRGYPARQKAAVVRWGPLEFYAVVREPTQPAASNGLLLFV